MFISCVIGMQSAQAQDSDLSAVAQAFDAIRASYVEPVDMSTIVKAATAKLQGLTEIDAANWDRCMVPGKPEGPKRFRDMLPIIDAFICAGYKNKNTAERRQMTNLVIAAMVKPLGGQNRWIPVDRDNLLPAQPENGKQPPEVVGRFVSDNAFLVAIPSIKEGTSGKIRQLVTDAFVDKMDILILDLRDNAGGPLDEAIAIADLFLDEGLIASVEGRESKDRKVFRARPGSIAAQSKIIVLANAATAAGSELIARALQTNRQAPVVGTKTAGAGSIQTLIPIPTGVLLLTTSRLLANDNQPLPEASVQPDCESDTNGAALIELAVGVADGKLANCATRPAMTAGN